MLTQIKIIPKFDKGPQIFKCYAKIVTKCINKICLYSSVIPRDTDTTKLVLLLTV